MAQLDLYCSEDGWDEEDNSVEESFSLCSDGSCGNLSKEQLTQERDELVWLASKEKSQKRLSPDYVDSLRRDHLLGSARKEAVQWILSVIAHYKFTAHTAVLAVHFLDRFLSTLQFQVLKRSETHVFFSSIFFISCPDSSIGGFLFGRERSHG